MISGKPNARQRGTVLSVCRHGLVEMILSGPVLGLLLLVGSKLPWKLEGELVVVCRRNLMNREHIQVTNSPMVSDLIRPQHPRAKSLESELGDCQGKTESKYGAPTDDSFTSAVSN